VSLLIGKKANHLILHFFIITKYNKGLRQICILLKQSKAALFSGGFCARL